jgi:integrase
MSRKKTDIKNVSYDDVKNLYYVTMYYGTDSNNKPVKKTVTCKTKSEAKSMIKGFEADKLRDEVVKPKNDTLEEWLDYWLENIVKPINESTTYYGYKAIVKHIKDSDISKKQLQKIIPKDIQEYLQYKLTIPSKGRKEPLSTNTVKKHYVLLRTALGLAQEQDFIRKNPMEKVVTPKYVKPKIKYYNIEQLQILFDLSEGTLLEPALYLAGLLGLRREEISGLKWSNVDLEKNILIVDEVAVRAENEVIKKAPKTETSIRKLTIPDILHDVLVKVNQQQIIYKQAYLKENSTDLNTNENVYVVSNYDGEPLNPAHLSSMFAKFIKKNNLSDISLRGLRHTVASVANSVGVTLFDISKMLGHASPDITGKVYVEEFSKHNENAINSVAEAISKKKNETSK